MGPSIWAVSNTCNRMSQKSTVLPNMFESTVRNDCNQSKCNLRRFVIDNIYIYTNDIVRSSLHGFRVGFNFFSVIFDHLFQLKDADLVTPEPLELHVFLRHNSELMTAVCEAIINCIKNFFEMKSEL